MIKDVKITIFGASGAIGKLFVKKALEDGYVVKAYVRNPSKLDFNHQNLEKKLSMLFFIFLNSYFSLNIP